MAKLPVAFQKIFAGGISPAGNVAQPGSTVTGTPVYTADPATLQALAAWADGLASQLINAPGGLSSPVLEELNGILLLLTYQIAYLKQAGIPEWDVAVTYYIGSFANVAGVPYVSKTDDNVGNDPTIDSTNWKTYASTLLGASDPLLKAWVVFDGRTGAIDHAFNVSNVSRTSAGIYQITFAAALAQDLYGFSGTPGTRPGAGFIPGDDNFLVGGVSGKTVTRDKTTCTVFNFDRPNNALEDSSLIAVQFFGS